MKTKEREEARRLRKELGLSTVKIAERLGVAKSSAYGWTKDIQLTEDQEVRLRWNSGCSEETGRKIAETWRKRREEYQEQGREKAKDCDVEYAMGCMLYWAEGTKGRSTVGFCNTDVRMMKFFVMFLCKYFSVLKENMSLRVNCYLGNGFTIEEIQAYWLSELGLPESCLTKSTIKNGYYGNRKVKHPYGVCTVRVCDVHIMQQIYGSIKALMRDDSNDWL